MNLASIQCVLWDNVKDLHDYVEATRARVHQTKCRGLEVVAAGATKIKIRAEQRAGLLTIVLV